MRGEVCPLDVDNVDLPPVGTEPVDVTSVAEEVAMAMVNRGAKMLHPDGEQRLADSGVRAFDDEALKDRTRRIR